MARGDEISVGAAPDEFVGDSTGAIVADCGDRGQVEGPDPHSRLA